MWLRTRGFAKVIVGAVGVVLSACGAPAPTGSSQTGLTVEACSNDDVQAALGEWEGAGGQIVGFVVLAAGTDRPCALAGTPEVRFIDASGRVIAEAAERAAAGGDPLIELAPGSGSPEPAGPRRGQGSFIFVLGNVCEPVADAQGRVEVRLAGESEALVFEAEIPTPGCTARGEPSFLGVQPFASPAPD